MKRIIIFGWVLGSMLVSSLGFGQELSGDFKPGTEPDGFRGIKWGQNISTVPGLKYVETYPDHGGIQEYTRKGDKLKIGGAKLKTIKYRFWRNKLYSVAILIEGSANWAGLRDAVFEKFGQGNQSNEYIERYSWFGETTRMELKYSEILEEGYLCMSSKKMGDQTDAYDIQKAKEGVEKGF